MTARVQGAPAEAPCLYHGLLHARWHPLPGRGSRNSWAPPLRGSGDAGVGGRARVGGPVVEGRPDGADAERRWKPGRVILGRRRGAPAPDSRLPFPTPLLHRLHHRRGVKGSRGCPRVVRLRCDVAPPFQRPRPTNKTQPAGAEGGGRLPLARAATPKRAQTLTRTHARAPARRSAEEASPHPGSGPVGRSRGTRDLKPLRQIRSRGPTPLCGVKGIPLWTSLTQIPSSLKRARIRRAPHTRRHHHFCYDECFRLGTAVTSPRLVFNASCERHWRKPSEHDTGKDTRGKFLVEQKRRTKLLT